MGHAIFPEPVLTWANVAQWAHWGQGVHMGPLGPLCFSIATSVVSGIMCMYALMTHRHVHAHKSIYIYQIEYRQNEYTNFN